MLNPRGYGHTLQMNSISEPSLSASLTLTIQWLIQNREFSTARTLLRTVVKHHDLKDLAFAEFVKNAGMECREYEMAFRGAQAIAEKTPSSENFFAVALALQSGHQLPAAENLYQQILAHMPANWSAALNLALVIEAQGRWHEATNILKHLAETEKHPEALQFIKYKLGWHIVREGHFREGMQMIRLGRTTQKWGAYVEPHSAPRLEDSHQVAGKTVLVCGEGGHGDAVVNFRFCRTLQERGAKVVYRNAHRQLSKILKRSGGFDVFVDDYEPVHDKIDFWVAAMDLPMALGLHKEDLKPDPYLVPRESVLEKWRELLGRPTPSRRRIGINWSSDKEADLEQRRNLPPHLIQQLISSVDADFYGFNMDATESAQFAGLNNLGPHLETWDDTLAAISEMDLIISSCSGLVHTAGALGKKTWVLTNTVPYYVWAADTNRSSWYKDVEIFREPALNAWEDPFKQIIDRLVKK